MPRASSARCGRRRRSTPRRLPPARVPRAKSPDFWIAAAAVRAGFAGEFDPMALPIFFAEVSLTLAAALLAALSYREPGRLLLIATALGASDAVYELAGLALPAIAEASGHPAAAFFVLLGWMWLVAVRAVAVCGG